MNREQAISYIAQAYVKNLSQSGMQKVFDKLTEEFCSYQQTGDTDTLRYLLALSLRSRHGRRMPWANTKAAVDILIKKGIQSYGFDHFSDLYLSLQEWFWDIPFARGSLMLYDASLNIGHFLPIPTEPEETIYLNAGAWEGALFLKDKGKVKHQMPVCEWQSSDLFPGIESMYIEDILCIFKPIFKTLAEGVEVMHDEVDERLKLRQYPFPKRNDVLRKLR